MESHLPQPKTSPKEILRHHFGFEEFREHQEAVIRCLVNGEDAFVLMPTGSGKSLCYQIPSIIRPGVGVVVSPLIALMQNQTDALRQLGIRADYLNSTLSPDALRRAEQRVMSGETDLVYVAPERLMTSFFLRFLAQLKIALFAIDESHCISQWGHDFRPEYLQLSRLQEAFPRVPRIALTATADPQTRMEILRKLGLEKARQFVSSFDRPNIRYRVTPKENAFRQLTGFLRSEHEKDSGIVYCPTRAETDKTANRLCEAGFKALPYHAGMNSVMRADHQRRFLREEKVIITATIAFGMGIDKPDVRFVAHLGMPKTIEAYYQETGRAGRDGEPADAWMVYGLSDMIGLLKRLEASGADKTFIQIQKRKADAMLGYCEAVECRRGLLLRYFGENYPPPCGNCDVCLGEVETVDGTEAARKALSCVYRTRQMFGADHLTDVLLGLNTAKIRKFGHDRVSTYGIGRELNRREWHSVFRRLLSAGYLDTNSERRGGYFLTPASRSVLRGDNTVFFRSVPRRAKTEKRKAASRKRPVFTDPFSLSLWEKLRALRLETAKEMDVPPYVVFHDKTLREMVALRPRNMEDMGRIHGVGSAKLEKFGGAFLGAVVSAVEAHEAAGLELPEIAFEERKPAEPPEAGTNSDAADHLTGTLWETWNRFQQGETPETVARNRDLTVGTVYSHLSRIIERGFVSPEEILGLDPDEIQKIEAVYLGLTGEEAGRLKPVFERFEGRYDYNILRCVIAGMPEAETEKAPSSRIPDEPEGSGGNETSAHSEL